MLNGTTTPNLAADVSQKLGKFGFQAGKTANFTSSSLTTTTIGFVPGHRPQALAVAKALKVKYSNVLQVKPTTEAARLSGGRHLCGRGVRSPRNRSCLQRVAARPARFPDSTQRTLMKDLLTLPARAAKPRETGITHILDRGLSVAEIDSLVEVAGEYIDFVKLGWGTAVATLNLEAKLARYQEHGLPVMFGGTLTELCIAQNRLEQFVAWLHELGLQHIELSDGTINLEHDRKLELISSLAQEFIVLSEVGSKDDTRIMAPFRWVEQIESELEAGRLEGDRRGARERLGRDLPPRRRGPAGPRRRDPARDRRHQDHLRGAAQGPAGVVRAPPRARRQPRQHQSRKRSSPWRRSGSACARTPPSPRRTWPSSDLSR